LSTSALRIAAPFFCNNHGGLNKGFYLPKTFQSYLSSFICHQWACHNYKYIYFPNNVNKKMSSAKKNIYRFRIIQEKGSIGPYQEREKYSLFIAAFPQLTHNINVAGMSAIKENFY